MKNYKSIYESALDSSAVNQAFFLKKETANGVMTAPSGADFLYTIGGGSLSFSQALEPSQHKSGRHNNNTIKQKKSLEWSLPLYVNIDTSEPVSSSLDTAVATLWESALGRKYSTVSSLSFDSAQDPSITFSVFEIGDMWSKQGYGCFVDGAEISLPGDGQAQVTFSGMGVESFLVGVSKSTVSNDGGNTVTVQAGQGNRFPVGSLVMLIGSDGTTRSLDTDLAPRKVISVLGDVVTLDGLPLTDADGSANAVYLTYWEPAGAAGIDNPQTGLVGEFISATMGEQCIRSATISLANNHELQNNCFGTDSLSGSLFVPASKLEVTCSVEINLNKKNVGIYNDVQAFTPQALQFKLGDSAGRHLEVTLPKVIFQIPSIDVPESGSIPVTFEGTAYQASDADEITVSYK